VGAIYTDLKHDVALPPPNNVQCTRYMSDDNTVFSAMEVLNAATMQAKYQNTVSRKCVIRPWFFLGFNGSENVAASFPCDGAISVPAFG
jgi:hypothetical protein